MTQAGHVQDHSSVAMPYCEAGLEMHAVISC